MEMKKLCGAILIAASFTPAIVQAEEAKTTPLLTALSATTISGYVDTSAIWNPGTGNANPAPFGFNIPSRRDGFNLDSVALNIEKPLSDEGWAAGYAVDLMFGPDAPGVTGSGVIGSGIGENIRQAYVSLHAPVGNGLTFKMGRWDTVIGYESNDAYKNDNFTRSYGWSVEPTEHTGLLGEYRFCDSMLLDVGVANTVTTGPINAKSPRAESKKAIVSLLTLTAPTNWGSFSGSTLAVGLDYGPGAVTHDRTHLYVGGTISLPITNLTVGAAWDSMNHCDIGGVDTGYMYTVAGYAKYQFTDKASLHLRGEYGRGAGLGLLAGTTTASFGASNAGTTFNNEPFTKVIALTGTFEYDLWANVISRIEVRWDHAADGSRPFGGTLSPAQADAATAAVGGVSGPTGSKKNDLMVAANLIFKF
ncbi:MAG: hypothetical protein JWO95_1144 [Verrucomicrobiales bacterium]|nr:hypothetical protein [Verrucomicrobiales bacterium]